MRWIKLLCIISEKAFGRFFGASGLLIIFGKQESVGISLR